MMLQMKWLSLPATLLVSSALFAFDGTSTLTGRIAYADRRTVTERLELRLVRCQRLCFTDDSGNFHIEQVPQGRLTIHIYSAGQLTDSLLVAVEDSVMDLGVLPVLSAVMAPEQPDAAIVTDPELQVSSSEGDVPESRAGMLLNGKDVFKANTFTLASLGFRPRGYQELTAQQYFGGVYMDELLQPNYLLWSGLSDIMRNANTSVTLEANGAGGGGVNGLSDIRLHAYHQTPQHKVSYALGNRSYDHKIQILYTTEITPKNWIWSFSGFRQWANETYAPGTRSDHWAAYASATKIFQEGKSLSVTALYHDNYREPRSPATRELFELSGSPFYNANWGWQNGSKRSARSVRELASFTVIEYNRSNSRSEWITAAAVSAERSAYSGLDWYRAPDPRPDYYRNLPSYIARTNQPGAEAVTKLFIQAPDLLQIDWKEMYDANTHNWDSVRYEENNQFRYKAGRQALYVQAADVKSSASLYLRSHLKRQLRGGGQLSACAAWNQHFSERYKQLADLLGADYFVDLNDFARQQFPAQPRLWSNDLNRFNAPLVAGDRYKYDYRIHASTLLCFAQLEQDFRHWTLFMSLEGKINRFTRTGVFVNGLYTNKSFGKGVTSLFPGYQVKAGITRKINGRHYISLRSLYSLRPPANFEQVYIAAATREQLAGRSSELCSRILAIEATYTLHAPRTNVQLSVYQTQVANGTQITRFYNDEPEFQCFVNMVQSKVAQRHVGIESAVSYSFLPSLSAYWVAAAGQSFYTANPQVSVYADNDTTFTQKPKSVEIAGYYSVTGPQTVLGCGLQIEGRYRWTLKAGCSYLDRNYIRINPLRRSSAAVEGVVPESAEARSILGQERLPSRFSADVMLSKAFRFKQKSANRMYNLYCFLNLSNLFNIVQKYFGYEQLRFDFENNDPSKYPNKYTYAPGRTFSAGVQIKW